MCWTFSQDASLSNFLIERAKKIIRLFIKANFKEIVNELLLLENLKVGASFR
jgi:hypothetical protein